MHRTRSLLHYFQLDSDHTSNWMKHVRLADNPQECNLAVFEVPQSVPFWQCSNGALSLGMVIFVTVRAILPNEELKVAYSWDYASRIGRGCLGNTATANASHAANAAGAVISSGLPADSTDAEHHSSTFINFSVSLPANVNVLRDLSPMIPDREEDANSECTDDEPISDSEIVNDFLSPDDECITEANVEETGAGDSIFAFANPITTASPVDNRDNDDTMAEMPVRNQEDCADLPLSVNVEVDRKSSEIAEFNQDRLKTKKHLLSRKHGKCLVCGLSFKDMASHLHAAHTEEDVRAVDDACFVCRRKFKSDQLLGKHVKMVHSLVSPPDETARLAALDYIRRTGFLHYRCAVCGKVFTSEALLNVHAFAHDTDKSRHEEQPERTCPGCAFTASTFTELLEHTGQHARYLRARSMRTQHPCILCGTHVDNMKNHAKSYHPEVLKLLRNKWPLQCSECPQIFISTGALKCHVTRRHGGRRCFYCGFRSPVLKTLNKHVKQHRVERLFPCPWCGSSFKKYWQLAAHVRDEHRDVENTVAEERTDASCEFQLPEQLDGAEVATDPTTSTPAESAALAEFIQHMKETATFSYYCSSCHLHFSLKALLDLHQIHHYADSEELDQHPEHRCPACEFEASCFTDLMHHTKEHGLKPTDKKPCAVCGEHFQHLKRHFRAQHPDIMKRLEEDWQFRCDECGERFKSENNLSFHIKSTHLGYQCLYCAKLFRKQKDLGLHVWPEHSVNGEFPCPSCDKTFANYPLTRQHYRKRHDVMQMKTCESCQHVCRGKKQLAEHMESVHDIPRSFSNFKRGMRSKLQLSLNKIHAGGFKCPECGKLLKTYKSLYFHKQNVHHFGMNLGEWNKILLSAEVPQKVAKPKVPKPRKRFTCDLCGIVVSSYNSLYRHKRWKHVGDYKEKFEKDRAEKKRLGIYTCWKTYKKPRDRMALEDFPHKCDVCQLGFVRAIALEKHNATRHPDDHMQQS
ncbi:zinc finger protein Xfin-like [Paramacrobiotus metropolitanus]|uniref:zinc finger protein Xfin-like n=1 Tax=Paramacrobiotus metropolitanus TaxID=2943436 RepID=UPI002445C64B|nr:zinc finger protein Xfin-like [Paramacrobiotus metropolitanus]